MARAAADLGGRAAAAGEHDDTGHTHNIFGVVFVPRTPGEVVTCAADGEVRHHDLEAQRSKLLLPTPGGGGGAFSDAPMAFKLAFLPGQPHALLCSYQDGAVRLLDLRVAAASRSADVVAQLGAGVLATSFAFHPAAPTMYALGADPDPLVRLLDLRRPSTTTADAALCFAPSHALAELSQMETPRRRWRSMRHGASGVDFSPSGVLAATYRDGPACLFDAARAAPTAWAAGEAVCCEALQLKGGHRNSRTFLKECRFLWDGRHVATGSDCGHLFVYEAYGTGDIASLLRADRHIVNCVAPHPTLPVVAASGIEHTIKLFQPVLPRPADARKAEADADGGAAGGGERAPSALSDAGSSLGSSLYGDDDEDESDEEMESSSGEEEGEEEEGEEEEEEEEEEGEGEERRRLPDPFYSSEESGEEEEVFLEGGVWHRADGRPIADDEQLVPEAVAIAVSSMVAAVAQNGGESEIEHVGIGSLAFPVGR